MNMSSRPHPQAVVVGCRESELASIISQRLVTRKQHWLWPNFEDCIGLQPELFGLGIIPLLHGLL